MPSRGASSDVLLLNVNEDLLRALETKEWGRPLALGTVVRDAIAKKEMMPVQEFMASRESIYHKPWIIKPWDIVSWGLKQLGLAGGQDGEDQLPVGRLVILANVQSAAKELARRATGQTTRTDRIFSKKLFYETFSDTLGAQNQMTEADMDVLLKFMARDKGILAYDGQTIKLKGITETDALKITSEDSTIASLKTLIADLQLQVDSLSQRAEKLSSTARDAISRKNRTSALAALRSKKLVETSLLRQSATLGQLEEVYAKIGQAADNVELVRIMEGSTGVLRSLNAQVGGAERVDDVVFELKEQMTQVEEIGNTLTEVGQGIPADEDEIDGELEAMEREDRDKKEEAKRLGKEERERQEVAETKRKLERLEAAEWKADQEHKEGTIQSSGANHSLDGAVNEMAEGLGQMSLDRQRLAETAT
jgi:charged multivesicular body protein 7